MANELKPCPFCGSDKVRLQYIRDGQTTLCQSCGANGPSKFLGKDGPRGVIDQAVTAWNTRPAAPVEGLERYGYDRKGEVVPYENGALVLYSQAEAVISAKDAKIDGLERMLRISEYRADNLSKRISPLEADNAALKAEARKCESSAGDGNSAACRCNSYVTLDGQAGLASGPFYNQSSENPPRFMIGSRA